MVDPDIFRRRPHTGQGDVPLSYAQRSATHLTPNLVFDSQRTLTIYGTLDSLGTPLPGEQLTFGTGETALCTAVSNEHGTASCVLTNAQAAKIAENDGRYTITSRERASTAPRPSPAWRTSSPDPGIPP